MGIDVLTKNQITRWALKSETLQADSAALKKHNADMNDIQNGSRNSADGSLLQWELLMPLATPEVEIVPFMVDWSKTEKHPSELLPNMNCELKELHALHPHPEIFEEVFNNLNYKLRIEKGDIPELRVILKTPNGTLKL